MKLLKWYYMSKWGSHMKLQCVSLAFLGKRKNRTKTLSAFTHMDMALGRGLYIIYINSYADNLPYRVNLIGLRNGSLGKNTLSGIHAWKKCMTSGLKVMYDKANALLCKFCTQLLMWACVDKETKEVNFVQKIMKIHEWQVIFIIMHSCFCC